MTWWIIGSVDDTTKKTVMYMRTAKEMWMYLEKRYTLSNGSLKYKLNRDLYSQKQCTCGINEYYTRTKGMWEEPESFDQLPIITISDEITKFLNTKFG